MPAEEPPRPYLGPLLGIVFDLDGTLVESAHDFLRMRRETIRIAERHGVMPGHLTIRDPIPKLVEQAISELALGGVPEGQRFRFEAEVNDSIDAIELEALPRTRAREGARALLSNLSGRGFRLGLLTRSSETFCRAALDRTQLKEFFPTLRTRGSPGPAKPSPEALLLLLHEMEVPIDRAVFIGDHPLDAECATRARVKFLGVVPEDGALPSPDAASRLSAAGAVAVGRDLVEIGHLLGSDPPAPAPPRAVRGTRPRRG
jgi:HAD superfamily hydrolase (TIGR01549 family)